MMRPFQRLFPYMTRRWRALTVGLACLLATNYLDIQAAVLLGSGIDLIALGQGPLRGVGLELLNLFLVPVALIALGAGVTRFWMRWLIIGVSRQVEFEFRNDLFAHLLRQSRSFYDRNRTGDLMSRATSDIEAVRVVIGPALMYVSSTGALIPMALWRMLDLSPLLTLLCWLPLALIAPTFYIFKRRIHVRFRRVQELMSDLSANIQENLAGVRVIKSAARETNRARGFEKLSLAYVTANIRLARLQALFIPLLGLMAGLTIIALLWGGAYLIIHNRLTIGSLVTFFLLLMSSFWPMIALGWVLAQLERGSASMARLEEIFRQKPDVADPGPAASEQREVTGAIEFRDLTFAYPNAARPALQNVTLTIPAGATIGLTGPVGCGKSTLAALIARRYNPPRGTLFVDGVDILDWPLEALRSQIGIVDQEPYLFSDTIRSNIAFGLGRDGATDTPAVERSARIAQLEKDVRELPQQYDTLLGERGINLSGGQRQRTALARALARDPAILILDDALAAVDTDTEEAILRGLATQLGRRTTVVISHRISTVSLADIICYLEDGRLVEQGTHQQLLERRGRYWALAQRQRLAEEIEKTA